MDQPSVKELEGRIAALIAQRDDAMNRVVLLHGTVFALQAELEKYKEKEDAQ